MGDESKGTALAVCIVALLLVGVFLLGFGVARWLSPNPHAELVNVYMYRSDAAPGSPFDLSMVTKTQLPRVMLPSMPGVVLERDIEQFVGRKLGLDVVEGQFVDTGHFRQR